MPNHLVGLAAHALLYSEDGRLLVIRRSGNPYLRGFWSVPAGHIELGESAPVACAREVREEVGIELECRHLTFALVQQKSGSDGEERVDFFFSAACTNMDAAFVASPREVAELRWVSPEELPTPFAPYVKSALSAIRSGSPYATWDL